MIFLRLRRTFRERAPEWALAFIQTGWGGTLLLPGRSFDRPFFKPLAAMASEDVWGWSCFIAGAIRLGALYINGSMRQTPRVRQICSLVSMLVWMMLTFSAMSLEWRSPAVFNYFGLFILEAIMFSYAGRDAARASAKGAANGAN